MSQPYVGEIRMFAGNFPPNGWMFCEGQPLPISENETLFQL
ncbi:MAG: tail fiber protein, partial [Acidobacteriota bacterium]|nr:tail fiber protein [Acidobacteriota bacterium]